VETIGCEPHPMLAESIRARGIPCLTVHEVAIAPASGTVMLFLNDDDEDLTPTTVFPAQREPGATDETLVSAMTFADFVDSGVTSVWGDEPVELLKIDIEAAEIALLLDTPAAILQRFQQITVEFHDFRDRSLGPDVRRAKERLRGLGFRELRFTLNNEDVLFVNERFFDTTKHMAQLGLLLRYRIIRGVLRRMHRRLLGREPADYVPRPYEAG